MFSLEAAVIHPPQRAGWRDIRDRAAESEQNPKRAAALARARQRLANELYPRPSLSALRLQRGLSQAEMARRIGTSQSHLSRIESGQEDPRRTTLVKIARELGETLDVVSNAIDACQGEKDD
jgi:DNA-binding XRE family transcriptional regulator